MTETVALPFPHVVIDDALPISDFAALRAEFPQEQDFSRSVTIMGGRQNLIRGNPAFTSFLSRAPTWAHFFGEVNSARFVGEVIRIFSSSLGARLLDVADWRFEDYTEPPLLDSTLGADSLKPSAAPGLACEHPSLYVTFDIARATTGYLRGPHLDARYKLASMLYFLNSSDEYQGSGAQFGLHRVKERSQHVGARFPPAEDVIDVAWVSPRANRLVMFLNSPDALHSVSQLEANAGHRQFLYIGVAARGIDDVWEKATK